MDWEHTWAPYSAADYAWVLAQVGPTDNVVEIGAGDLRLAIALAGKARQVLAIEWNIDILEQGRKKFAPLPPNLVARCADALTEPLPEGITLAVLLMRHCTHFSEWALRCRAAGCRGLITNARWGMAVEMIDLTRPPVPYQTLEMGWYACGCGATGFKPGNAEHWTAEQDEIVWEVCGCPACQKT